MRHDFFSKPQNDNKIYEIKNILLNNTRNAYKELFVNISKLYELLNISDNYLTIESNHISENRFNPDIIGQYIQYYSNNIILKQHGMETKCKDKSKNTKSFVICKFYELLIIKS